MLLDPRFWLATLIAALVLFSSGYASGNKAASSACVSGQAKAQQKAQDSADEINDFKEKVSRLRETSREQIRVTYRNIKEKADETIPHLNDCSLDADGMREWNAANSGSIKTMRSQPDYRLSGSTQGGIRASGRLAAEPHRGDGTLYAVSRPAP